MRPPKLLDRDALMEYAARTLAARALSSSELQTRLRKRAAVKEDVDGVLTYLKELGYADDTRFAGAFAEWRKDSQGLGQARVVRDLVARRVAPKVAQAAVQAAYQDSDETALIESFLARKYRGKDLKTLLTEPKNLASAYRKLRTAGFGGSTSIRVLKRYASAAEQIEEAPEESSDESS